MNRWKAIIQEIEELPTYSFSTPVPPDDVLYNALQLQLIRARLQLKLAKERYHRQQSAIIKTVRRDL